MLGSMRVFASSLLIGFSIAAPVGPIGVLIVRRTLARGRLNGLVSGLGAATADGVYGLLAAFGLTALSAFLVEQSIWLRLCGGLFLLYLGVKTLLAVPAEEAASTDGGARLLPAYGSVFALTLTNPMTILAFLGIFSGLGAAETGGDYGAASVIVAGVFAGSALWWLTLSTVVGLLRGRLSPALMLWVNRLSGSVIVIFALNILRQTITAGSAG